MTAAQGPPPSARRYPAEPTGQKESPLVSCGLGCTPQGVAGLAPSPLGTSSWRGSPGASPLHREGRGLRGVRGRTPRMQAALALPVWPGRADSLWLGFLVLSPPPGSPCGVYAHGTTRAVSCRLFRRSQDIPPTPGLPTPAVAESPLLSYQSEPRGFHRRAVPLLPSRLGSPLSRSFRLKPESPPKCPTNSDQAWAAELYLGSLKESRMQCIKWGARLHCLAPNRQTEF